MGPAPDENYNESHKYKLKRFFFRKDFQSENTFWTDMDGSWGTTMIDRPPKKQLREPDLACISHLIIWKLICI